MKVENLKLPEALRLSETIKLQKFTEITEKR